MSNEQNNRKIIDGYIREHQIQIPTEIIILIFQFYHLKYELLKFDPQYKSEPVKISDDGRCASKIGSNWGWVLAGGEAIVSGIAAWRLKVW